MRKIISIALLILFLASPVFAGDSVFNPKKDINDGPEHPTKEWVRAYVNSKLEGLSLSEPECDWSGWKRTPAVSCKSCPYGSVMERCDRQYFTKEYCQDGEITSSETASCCSSSSYCGPK